mmetsp:Transcript_49228/g.137903  ORF Transcript_49228/g.137903 Transcript_49228/m.137903 type:complete len:690 (-) Transcript_49228:104-2173(-)
MESFVAVSPTSTAPTRLAHAPQVVSSPKSVSLATLTAPSILRGPKAAIAATVAASSVAFISISGGRRRAHRRRHEAAAAACVAAVRSSRLPCSLVALRAQGDAEAPMEAGSDEAELLFKEAHDAEVEREALLRGQLEVAIAEQLGLDVGAGAMRISVEAPALVAPVVGGWRAAYEAVKGRTVSLEAQLNKARAMNQPATAPAAPSPATPTQAATDASSTMGVGGAASNPRQMDGMNMNADKSPEAMQRKLVEVAEYAMEDEAVLRLIALATVPNRMEMFGQQVANASGFSGKTDSLPPSAQISDVLGNDNFSTASTVVFDRCYVFKGSVPVGRDAGPALEDMQRRVRDIGTTGANVELFLQPGREEGRSLVVAMLKSDLPSSEIEASQWVFFVLLFLVTLLAANSTTFAVVTMKDFVNPGTTMDVDTVLKVGAKCLPTAAGILATVFSQEAARRVAASTYNVELAPPLFIPCWPFASAGCLGAVNRRQSTVPNRDAEYAMAISSAATGLVVALSVIALGFTLGPESDKIVNLNYQLLPVLMKVVFRPFLGTSSLTDSSADPFADPVSIAFPANPVLVGGIVGLISVCLNLLPIGKLDGGVLARAAFGPGGAGAFGFTALALLLVGSFSPSEAGTMYTTFAITTIIWQNGSDLPPRNGMTPVGGAQQALAAMLVIVGFLLSIPGWAFPSV